MQYDVTDALPVMKFFARHGVQSGEEKKKVLTSKTEIFLSD